MEQQAQWPDDWIPGYRFKPKARELIHYYLNPWVTSAAGEESFGERKGVVCTADVYSADPGTLTSRLRHYGHDDGNWYFLSVARWKDGNVGTRMSRAVKGGGTWHGSGKRIAVRRHGYRQTFEYRDAGGGKSAWLMEEFGTAMPEATGGDGVKVICRVHRTPRAAADDGDDDERQETTDAKRPRLAPSQEHGFAAADYWTTAAAPDGGCSYASTSRSAPPTETAGHLDYWTTTAPAPPDVGCSYASTFHSAPPETAGDSDYRTMTAPAPPDVGCSLKAWIYNTSLYDLGLDYIYRRRYEVDT